MVNPLDREGSKWGVTRQSVIKVWLAGRLELTASNLPYKVNGLLRRAVERHFGRISDGFRAFIQ